MFPLWNFFLRKNRFSYLLIAFLAVAGLVSAIIIPKESNPEVTVPIGIVSTILPGASAEDIEQVVTNEIEDKVINLDGVRKLTSSSREGFSSVVVEFEADVDIDESIQELKDEVDLAATELPSEAEDPFVSQVDFSRDPILIMSLSSDIPVSEFRKVINDVKDELEGISGVAEVNTVGLRDREVQVVVSKEKLENFGLSLGEVVSAISFGNSSLPIGGIDVDGISYDVRFEGDIEETSEIENITITRPGSSEPIYIRDIALVSDGSSEEVAISRLSLEGDPSKPAVTLSIVKRSGGNILETSDTVKGRLAELSDTTLRGVDLSYTFDVSEFIREDLGNLVRSGVQTILLVMALLLAFVGWREALIAGLAIPFSFLISFIGLNLSGNTINFVSLFSLILAIGILVDSAIVVTEAMHTKIKNGLAGTEAARETLREYSWPLISGTMTTVAAFLPLAFISGITGEFIKSIPFTVVSVLLASLFVALGITPLISSVLIKRNGNNGDKKPWSEKLSEKLQGHYRRILEAVVGNKKRERNIMIAIVLVLIIAIAMPVTGALRVVFFEQSDVDFVFVELEKPFGTVLELTDLGVREVEELLYDKQDIESFVTTIGASSSFNPNGSDSGSHLGNITINLVEDRSMTSSAFLEVLEEEFKQVESIDVSILQVTDGPPTGAPISIRLLGDDSLDLEKSATRVAEILEDIPGTREVDTSAKDNGIEFALNIDRAKAASLGITPAAVARELRTAVSGADATTLREGDEDIDVVVKLALNENFRDPHDTARTTIDTVRKLSIQSPSGPILLDSVVDVELRQGSAIINHEAGTRVVTTSSFIEDGANVREIIAAFESEVEDLVLPEGVVMEIGGENEDVDQSFREMFYALIVGMFLIASILIIQFNSIRQALFIILVPPLSMGGLLLGLTFTGQTLSFPSLMGFITLAGIVVNNSIILIDAANHRRRNNGTTGEELRSSMINAAVGRLRPIVLTTLTTVAGMVPLMLVSELWGPLAVAVIFGLSYSLILTLLLTPILYTKYSRR